MAKFHLRCGAPQGPLPRSDAGCCFGWYKNSLLGGEKQKQEVEIKTSGHITSNAPIIPKPE